MFRNLNKTEMARPQCGKLREDAQNLTQKIKLSQVQLSSVKLCQVLSSFVKFCQVLSSSVKFCQVLSSSAKFSQYEFSTKIRRLLHCEGYMSHKKE